MSSLQAPMSLTRLPAHAAAFVEEEAMPARDRKGSSGNTVSPIGIIRHYLTTYSAAALEAESMHNEFAMRARIILEYMSQYAITDVHQGIRQFTAFERQRLYQLGIIAPQATRASLS